MTPRHIGVAVTLFVISVPLVGWAVEVGVALTPSHFLAFVLLGLAARTWFTSRFQIPRDTPVRATVAFLLVATLSVAVLLLEPDIEIFGESARWKSTKQLIGLGFGTGFFIALYCLLRWYNLGLRALQAHYWTTAGFAVLALLQYGAAVVDMDSSVANFPVRNSTLGELRQLSLMYGFPRISLTLVEPSLLASYLLSGWAFWLYALDCPPFISARAQRLFVWSGVLLGVALILTGSRLAYAVAGMLVVGALTVRPHRVRRGALFSLSVVIALLLTGTQHTSALMRTLIPNIGSLTDMRRVPEGGRADGSGSAMDKALMSMETAVVGLDISVQQRTASYIVAMDVLRERPFLGSGFGTSTFYMERYWPRSFVPLHETRVTSPIMLSHYATIASETGLLGVLCLAVFTIGILRRLLELSRKSETDNALAFGVGASVGSYFISGIAAALIVYQILLVWLLLALALTVTTTASPPNEDNASALA
jgi:hypothetical protein